MGNRQDNGLADIGSAGTGNATTAAWPAFGPVAAVAVLAGMGACLFGARLPPWTWMIPLAVAALGLWWRAGRWRWIGAALFGFASAALHAGWALSDRLPAEWEQRTVTLTGTVADLPKHEARRSRFEFRIEQGEGAADFLRGHRVMLSWYDDFNAVQPGERLRLRAGERWRLQASLRAPRGLRNPGGFDAERHALARRIDATGYLRNPGQAKRIAPAAGIDAWREAMSARIGQSSASPSARFIRALALGDTRGLAARDWEVLRANGLTHLIAISGFHVGMVAGVFGLAVGGLWRLFPGWARWVPRPQAMALAAVLAALGYAALAGFALPTVRTVLMMAVWACARLGRRPARVADALALALLAMLLVDPLSLLAAGFWLSFAGVAWLAWCLPADERHWLRGFLSAQAVATIGLLPLTVMLFGQASLAGPLANLLAIPWWTFVVVPLSLLGTALDALLPGLGEPAWRGAAACFDLAWPVFLRLAASPHALWWLPEATPVALMAALAGGAWMLMPRGVPGRWLAGLLWLPLLWPDRGLPRPGEAQVAMIDVGQGLAVLVRTARHSLLYDMGPAVRDGFDAGERAVVPALRAWGVRRLDRVVVSHADNDHAGGFGSVRAVMPIRFSQAPAGGRLPVDAACRAGEGWEWDGVRFRFLHPARHFPYLGNEASCVLRVETAHGAALLAGDIGEVVERQLVREQAGALRAHVVFAAHHGSAGSSDPAFVAATGARLVLISNGHRNRFGHPHPAVAARWERAGAEVLESAGSGAVQVWLVREGLSVRERRHAHRRIWDADVARCIRPGKPRRGRAAH